MDMSIYNHTMLALGTTNKRREGDYIVTYEVVGWNEKAKCNSWAEKSRRFSPATSISTNALVEAIKRSEDFEFAKRTRSRLRDKKLI